MRKPRAAEARRQQLRQILGMAAEGAIADASTRAFLQAFVDRFAALVGKLATK